MYTPPGKLAGSGPLEIGRLGSRYHHMRLIACAVTAVGLTFLGAFAWLPLLAVAGIAGVVGGHAYWRKHHPGPVVEALLVDTTAVIIALFVMAPPFAAGFAPVVVISTTAALFLGDRRALGVAAYATIGVSAALTWGHMGAPSNWDVLESTALVGISIGALSPLMFWLLEESGRALSQRRALEETLRERESRYRVIAENVSDAIITIDEQSTIVYANPAAERIFGYGPEELAGEDVTILMPRRYRAAHRLGMLKYLATGERRMDWNGMNLVGLHRDGRELDLEVSFGESDVPEGRRFIATVRDMTERREADEALRESETRYRGLFERVPVGVYRTSTTGEIVDANPVLAQLLGYDDPNEVVGLPAERFYVDPSDREAWRAHITELTVLAGHEVQLRRADGETIWVRDSGREVRDEDGRIVGYEGTLEDVTQRRRAEDRLRSMVDSQQRRLSYERALSACSQALLAGTDDRALEEALEALHEATGVSAVFVERNNTDAERGVVTDLIYEVNTLGTPPEYDHWTGVPWSAMPEAHRRLSRGEPYAFGIRDLQGGEEKLYEGTLTRSELDIPIFVGSEWAGVIGFADFEDERPWRDDEISLLRTAAQMIGAFWERREAHQKLQELVRYKDEFVASVSHELRTPLTAVVGLAEELAGFAPGDFSSEELAEFHRLIAQQGREVAYIVEDLLVAARVDIDKVSIDIQPVDLDAEVASTIDGWPSEFGHIEYTPGEIKVLADPTRFRQIARNLLTNAIRYGGDHIRVITGSERDLGFLQVRDDGAGISEEDAERIFQPYERASGGGPTKQGSVGLGLYVSRQLARLMDGDLGCRREDGETVFELTLPLL